MSSTPKAYRLARPIVDLREEDIPPAQPEARSHEELRALFRAGRGEFRVPPAQTHLWTEDDWIRICTFPRAVSSEDLDRIDYLEAEARRAPSGAGWWIILKVCERARGGHRRELDFVNQIVQEVPDATP